MSLRAGYSLVPVPMNDEFIRVIASGMKQLGYANRSDFVRDAILEKFARAGIVVDPGIAAAPSRVGVNRKSVPQPLPPDRRGLGPKGEYLANPPAPKTTSSLNETQLSSGVAVQAAVDKFQADTLHELRKGRTH